MNLKNLGDRDLISQTKDLVQSERDVLTRILHHLREIERRKLFCDFGCGSLFEYAVKELKYSEGQAGRRIQAMRLLKEIPELEEKIQSGALSLSNISQAQSFFREAARSDFATSASKTTAEKIQILSLLEHKSARDGQKELLQLQPEIAPPKEKERVLTEDLSEIRFVMNSELKAKLEEVRSLLGPAGAAMSFAELLEQLTELSVAALKAKKFGKKVSSQFAGRIDTTLQKQDLAPINAPAPTPEPRIKPESKNPRYIPQKTQHFVWQRDRKQCVLCSSTRNLNIDHMKPVALGGTSIPENLRLLCFACNQRAGIRIFGVDRMGSGG